MAINYGNQINAALQSAYDRADRSREFVSRLNQQMQEFQFRKQTQELVNRVRQKKLQLEQEAQAEAFASNIVEQQLQQEREQRLRDMTDQQIKESQARIKHMGDGGGSGGGSSALDYTNLQTINSQLSKFNKDMAELQGEQEKLFNASAEDANMTSSELANNFISISNQIRNLSDRIAALNAQKNQIMGVEPAQPVNEPQQRQTPITSSVFD